MEEVATVSIVDLERDLPAFRQWIRDNFTFIPGAGEINMHPRPGRGIDNTFTPSRGPALRLADALKYLLRVHGGLVRVLTEAMRDHIRECRDAKKSIDGARQYLRLVYAISTDGPNLVFRRKEDGQTQYVYPRGIAGITGFKDVAFLGQVHGPALGTRLYEDWYVPPIQRSRSWRGY